MITTKEAKEIIEAVLERVEICGYDDTEKYTDISPKSMKELIIIIRDYGDE